MNWLIRRESPAIKLLTTLFKNIQGLKISKLGNIVNILKDIELPTSSKYPYELSSLSGYKIGDEMQTLIITYPIDKNSQEYKQLVSLGFQFMITCIAESKFETISEFNNSQNKGFGLSAILVYPFFVAVSGKYSRALFDLFGDFYTFTFGPASMSIHKLLTVDDDDITKNESGAILKYFDDKSNGIPTSFNIHTKSDVKNFSDLKSEILKAPVRFDNGETVEFRNVCVSNEKNEIIPLPNAIQDGVDVINRQTRNNFFEGDKSLILFKAKYFPKFNKSYNNNELLKMEYDDTISLNEKPFPLETARKPIAHT